MYRIVFLLLSSVALLNCTSEESRLPYYNTPDFTPIFIKKQNEVDKKIDHTIASFSFLNQDSVLISEKEVEGKIHVANFVFTSCGSICPKMTSNMNTINQSFRIDSSVVLLSYSVTPWIDQPWMLRKYKSENTLDNPNWHFLTGSKSAIYTLARKSYFAEEDLGYTKDSTEFLHTEHFILVDKTKRIRGIYNGTLLLEMEQLIEDINVLKNE